jgi:hypothetical protein
LPSTGTLKNVGVILTRRFDDDDDDDDINVIKIPCSNLTLKEIWHFKPATATHLKRSAEKKFDFCRIITINQPEKNVMLFNNLL